MKFLNKQKTVTNKTKKAPSLPEFEFKFNKNFWNKEVYLAEKFKYPLKTLTKLYVDEVLYEGTML